MPPISFVTGHRESGKTLAAVLKLRLNLTWSQAKRLVEAGRVRVGQQVERDIARRLKPGKRVELDPSAVENKSKGKAPAKPQAPLKTPAASPKSPKAKRNSDSPKKPASPRLFTEVREKRGLCYSVGVRHETFKDRGTMVGYAGTGADRAQQTLDVTLAELKRLSEGATEDEIDRVKAGLKSSLIMQEESTSARAGSIASDWYFLGRVRTFDEIHATIDGLKPASITGYLEEYPVKDVTLVTLGPAELKM